VSALPPEADMLLIGINVCYVPIGDTSQIRQKQRPPRGGLCGNPIICSDLRLKTDAPENDIFYDKSLLLHRVAATWVIEGLAFLKHLTSIE
jgi:hypothetical protein